MKRRVSKRDAQEGLKLTRAQQDKLVEDMLLSDADREERAMVNPRRPMELPATGNQGLLPNKKGERRGGRKKGTPNKLPNIVKEAGVMAAEAFGYDGKGKGGLFGYLFRCAGRYPKEYLAFLGKVMGHQKIAKQFNFNQLEPQSPEAIIEEMRMLGLPVEHLALFQLAHGSSVGSNSQSRPMVEVNPDDRSRRRSSITIEHGS